MDTENKALSAGKFNSLANTVAFYTKKKVIKDSLLCLSLPGKLLTCLPEALK